MDRSAKSPTDCSPSAPQDDVRELERAPRKHDETYKDLFFVDAAKRILVRDFVAKGWAHLLDPTIEPFPTEFVDRDLKRRICDCAMRLRFKDGRSVIALVEFQSSGNPAMALRMMGYSWAATSALHANQGLRDPDGSIPLVLSFVFYTGKPPWRGASSLAELVRRGELPPEVAKAVRGLGATHAHQVLDLRRAHAQDSFAEDSVLGWLAVLEEDPWKGFPRVLRLVAKHWGGPEHVEARAALARWTAERMRADRLPKRVRNGAMQLITTPEEGKTRMNQSYAKWAESHWQQGRATGRTEGRATLIVRQASRRFGSETGAKLAELVQPMGAEQLARVGDAVVECGDGDELLEVAANGTAKTG